MYKVMYDPAKTFHQVMHLLSAVGDGPSHTECYDTTLPTPHDILYLFSQKSPLHGLAHTTRITTASVNALVETDVGLFIGLLPSFFGRTAGAHSELLTILYYSLDIPHITSLQS
jgi:hypothetical protein